jgi:hypothetical protein
LRSGVADAAVIQLRAGYLTRPTDLPEFYYEALLTAVKQYQAERDDGRVPYKPDISGYDQARLKALGKCV